MFESLHERGLAFRTLARLDQAPALSLAANGGSSAARSHGGARRLAERRLARSEIVVVDPSYRSPNALLDALEGTRTLRVPRAGGAAALAAALRGEPIEALHLLCAAVPHALVIGGEAVDPRATGERAAASIEALRSVFARGGEAPMLMLYGSTFASGAEGAATIQCLADRLDAAVAVTTERMESPADRATWHAKAKPRRPQRVVPVGRQTLPTAMPDRSDSRNERAERFEHTMAQLRQRLIEHRRRHNTAPEPAPPPSPARSGEVVANVAENGVEQRLQATFQQLRERVLDHRGGAPARVAVSAPAEPEAASEFDASVNAPIAPPKPRPVRERSRIVRRRADGSLLGADRGDGSSNDDPGGVVPVSTPPAEPDTQLADAVGFDQSISMAPLADPMSALHAIMATEPETEPEPEPDPVPEVEPEPEPALRHGTPPARTPGPAPRTVPTPIIGNLDTGGALHAFSVEAMVRPEPFASGEIAALGEGITLAIDGPRVRFALCWDASSVHATADLTVLGIEDPAQAPVHLVATVQEGWASLYVEGALAASVPLGAGGERAWTVRETPPSSNAFDGDIALLRLVPRALSGAEIEALRRETRAGEMATDHRWATGVLAPTSRDPDPVGAPATVNPVEDAEHVGEAPATGIVKADGDDAIPEREPDEPIVAAEPSSSAPDLAVAGAERAVVPGEALALDLPALAGCALADVVRAWPVTMPPWLKLDPLEGIAHGRVPRDHPPGTLALVVSSANSRGATATLAVTLRVTGTH